ncbi:hypothetical protein A3K93_11275 [Acinetobacter sp. NCu2D-2]|uniref:hypothetical protein n=1 Tax=Acinetobacter sp. NCu2D-2 TaxID=1608473 RepID=UPI0007CDE4B9|nr:hypothetical protein [Acinetobacter sp. NCu2D-2]ANF82712.1 hypothetical protein A3K93_11275 [Acinetobacter sp. NCu2D-2]
MKLTVFTTSILSLFLLLTSQLGYAVVVKENMVKQPMSTLAAKSSPIEKALQQQNAEKRLQSEDNLKMLTALKVAPAQSFLAEQNLRFSRLLQTLFASSSS